MHRFFLTLLDSFSFALLSSEAVLSPSLTLPVKFASLYLCLARTHMAYRNRASRNRPYRNCTRRTNRHQKKKRKRVVRVRVELTTFTLQDDALPPRPHGNCPLPRGPLKLTEGATETVTDIYIQTRCDYAARLVASR